MIRLKEEISFNDYVLLIPSVSVGNVGQLTNDLIISGLNLKSVGIVYHKAIIPAIGPNPYNPSDDICVACELYVSKNLKLAILQLRTSIEQRLANEFFSDLKLFITSRNFKEVIILASTYAHELHDINSGHYRYITNTKNEVYSTLKILPMEQTETGNYMVHGSGFALKLYNLLMENILTSVIIKYTSEGDNRPDAYSMLNVVGKVLNIESELKDVRQPYSWDLVYGGPPPIGIY